MFDLPFYCAKGFRVACFHNITQDETYALSFNIIHN